MLLALSEIARAKVRFGLLAGAVGLLVFLILFQQALLGGLVTTFVGAVDNQDSPVLVFSESARNNVEGSFLPPGTVEQVASVDGVADAAPIGEGTFTVEAGGERVDAVLFGYELGGLGQPTTLVDGRFPKADFEAVASEGGASGGFSIGDTVTFVGEQEDETVEVVGIAQDAQWSVTQSLFASFATFEAVRQAVDPGGEAVPASLVAVRPADGADLDELTDRIDAQVRGVEALTNNEATEGNPGVQGVNQSFTIILGLAFVVVTLVVGFFFLILTVQKAKPLTLLRAVGAPAGYLVRNLAAQILAVLAVGSAVGVALVLVVGSVASGDVPIELRPTTIGVTIASLALLSLLGGAAAVRRVLRIDPVDATTSAGANF